MRSNRKDMLTVNEGDDSAGSPADFPQGAADILRSVGNCRTGGGRDLGQALGRLGGSRRRGLLGLGGRLGGVVSDGGPAEQELRLPPQHGTGRRDGHFFS